MKNKWFILCAAVLQMAAVADAAPSCVNGTLSFYQSTYGSSGCMIGSDYLVRDFSYLTASAFATPVTPSNINVTPTLGAGGPELLFSANWQVSFLGLSESAILFAIDAVGNTPFVFDGVQLNVTGSRSGLVSAPSVTEVNCLGGLLNIRSLPYTGLGGVACLGGGPELQTTAALPLGTNVNASGHVVFSPTANTVDVVKNIALTGVLGSASVTSIGQVFGTVDAEVPEPITMLTAGLSLVGIGLLRLKQTGGME